MVHISVLLHESIEGLALKSGDVFLDGTLGGGGHSEAVCKQFGSDVRIIGLDADSAAISRSKERLQGCAIEFVQSNFRDLDRALDSVGVEKVDKILLDIGLSSNQFEESGRGFSFQKDEPLLMTFKENPTESDVTAREIVNTWDEENISAILEGYGEERYARRIAHKIAESRKEKPIETTFDLVKIVKSATPFSYHFMRIHPATRTFQALRIAVNDEIEALKEGIKKGFERLNIGGRMAVISFHSLEDRVVKNFNKEREEMGTGKIITKKPVVPSEEEATRNPRSRSAKLRIIEKVQ